MAAETGKQLRSSGSSSDESDTVKDEDAGSNIRRSFECTYCKRGFTNAQALGGHMNIHRKDRAKAKKVTAAPATKSTNSYSNDPASCMMRYRQIAPSMSTSTIDSSRYGNWEAQRAMMSSSLHMYRPSAMSGALTVNQLATGGSYYHPEAVRPSNEMGSNLSLRVGPAASNIACNNNIDDDGNQEEDNNEDVDLELRLGPR